MNAALHGVDNESAAADGAGRVPAAARGHQLAAADGGRATVVVASVSVSVSAPVSVSRGPGHRLAVVAIGSRPQCRCAGGRAQGQRAAGTRIKRPPVGVVRVAEEQVADRAGAIQGDRGSGRKAERAEVGRHAGPAGDRAVLPIRRSGPEPPAVSAKGSRLKTWTVAVAVLPPLVAVIVGVTCVAARVEASRL